ncbi:hypothetical protein ANCCAN_15932 [Ancylostoma caninum]|uniref:Uncharacterized protein n=1 Tax=Ancylostoma caninum TaxID=29170 RepID=A0A368G1C5_ANCCA|nr:hypothetical protein ANCCAN_15932 [Ancylostoma caninum]
MEFFNVSINYRSCSGCELAQLPDHYAFVLSTE